MFLPVYSHRENVFLTVKQETRSKKRIIHYGKPKSERMKYMIKFGTGGWRAVIAEDFTFSNVRRVAKGVADYLREIGQAHKPVVIGHDLRFLSGRFSRAFAEVLAHED